MSFDGLSLALFRGASQAENITRRLAAVAFADVAGWSRLVDANELESLRAWNALRTGLIEPKIREHAGRLVDLAGDAVLVEFPSAIDAVNWALDLQRRPTEAGVEAFQLWLRIGINVCDVLVDEGRLIGDGVNIASRIHQVASPGKIDVTETVREHLRHRIPVAFRDLGERELKNISRPIRAYRVEAQGLPLPEALGADGEPSTMRSLLALELPQIDHLSQRGQRETVPRSRWLDAYLATEVLPKTGGRFVRQHENNLLFDFPNARHAVRAAFAIQEACSKASHGQDAHRPMSPRMGVQMGAPLADAADVAGSGASVAARLTVIGGPGEIVVSSAVREEITSILDAEVEDLGECYLGAPIALIDPKGVTKALLELAAGAAHPAALDPQAMHVTLSDAQIDAIFDHQRTRPDQGDGDLVAIGAAAIGALVAGLLRSM